MLQKRGGVATRKRERNEGMVVAQSIMTSWPGVWRLRAQRKHHKRGVATYGGKRGI